MIRDRFRGIDLAATESLWKLAKKLSLEERITVEFKVGLNILGETSTTVENRESWTKSNDYALHGMAGKRMRRVKN